MWNKTPIQKANVLLSESLKSSHPVTIVQFKEKNCQHPHILSQSQPPEGALSWLLWKPLLAFLYGFTTQVWVPTQCSLVWLFFSLSLLSLFYLHVPPTSLFLTFCLLSTQVVWPAVAQCGLRWVYPPGVVSHVPGFSLSCELNLAWETLSVSVGCFWVVWARLHSCWSLLVMPAATAVTA